MFTMINGLRFARQLVETRALGQHCREEMFPGRHILSDQALGEYILETCDTVYHPSGTCKMGSIDSADTVVDTNLKIKGLQNARVCDASVFPSMVTVNINNTVMMVAEKSGGLSDKGSSEMMTIPGRPTAVYRR